MKKPNLRAICRTRAIAPLCALLLAALVMSLILVGSATAAPPATLPAAPGREAPPQSPVRQALQETPILPPGAAKSQTKAGAGKSENLGKTPIRAGASDSLASSGASSGGSSFVAVMASLTVVIGLLFLVLWTMRRAMPGGTRRLPAEVVDVLGHVPLANRQQAQLIRLGKKLLLISVTTTGAETLTEVTDPEEVELLTNLARQPAAATPAASFRQILQSLERKPSSATGAVKLAAKTLSVPSAGQERARG